MRSGPVLSVVRAYDDPVVRAYCWVRFGILRQRFLDEIGQYLPPTGPVLDIGCGFGLFSLYYALTSPGRMLQGVDRNARRIRLARQAAARLHLRNVSYEAVDARDLREGPAYAAIYMLDIVHHVPEASVEPMLRRLHQRLVPGGRLLIKDVDTEPVFKRWFTWTLDRLMDPRTPLCYWPAERLHRLLEQVGFVVHRHLMVDVLPYPHVLYVCTRRDGELSKGASGAFSV